MFTEIDKPVYYDSERKQLYWIEWLETGNNDIPTKHYIIEEKHISCDSKEMKEKENEIVICKYFEEGIYAIDKQMHMIPHVRNHACGLYGCEPYIEVNDILNKLSNKAIELRTSLVNELNEKLKQIQKIAGDIDMCIQYRSYGHAKAIKIGKKDMIEIGCKDQNEN